MSFSSRTTTITSRSNYIMALAWMIFLFQCNVHASIIVHPFITTTTASITPFPRLNRCGGSKISKIHALLSSPRGGGGGSIGGGNDSRSHKQRWGMINPSSSLQSGDDSSSFPKTNAAPSSSIKAKTSQQEHNTSPTTPLTSLAASAAALPPAGRFIRAALFLYGASELLSFFGFFQTGGEKYDNASERFQNFLSQNTPQNINQSLERIKRNSVKYVEKAQYRAQKWWEDEIGPLSSSSSNSSSLKQFWFRSTERTRFGIGALCGYVILQTPTALISYPLTIGRWMVFSYFTCELLHGMGLTGKRKRIDDYVDRNAVREFGKETDLVNELEDVLNFVDDKLKRVDGALEDFKLSNRKQQGKRRRRWNVRRWADETCEDYRRYIRNVVLQNPQRLVDHVIDVTVEERHLGVGLIIGSFMGSILR
uniref:Uncharacterized protein n=1 Tax=Ditylum brightwellii TaxID=49249 RepID=A0A7S4V7P6_9STRA